MVADEAAPRVIFAKMANTLSASNRLPKTYNPVDLAAASAMRPVRLAGAEKVGTKAVNFCNGTGLDFVTDRDQVAPSLAASGVTGRTKFNDFNVSCNILAPGSCSKRQKSCNSEGTGIEAR